jgi:hypothetical protein
MTKPRLAASVQFRLDHPICSKPLAALLAASASMSALVCGVVRTFFGDFLRRRVVVNMMITTAQVLWRLAIRCDRESSLEDNKVI